MPSEDVLVHQVPLSGSGADLREADWLGREYEIPMTAACPLAACPPRDGPGARRLRLQATRVGD